MLRHLRVLFCMLFCIAVVPLLVAPVMAENWVEIPGRIEFDADDGTVKHMPFSSWATHKETFVPAARGNDIRLAGYFAFKENDQFVVMHVTEAESYTLQGDGYPIIITFKDQNRTQKEVDVVKSFIWAIARMEDFFFMARDEALGREVVTDVPSESVRRLWFYGPPPDAKASRFPVE